MRNKMDSSYPDLYENEVKAIRKMIREEIEAKIKGASRESFDSGAFCDLLLDEFRVMHMKVDNMKGGKDYSKDEYAYRRNVVHRLEALEKLMSNPDEMLTRAIEGFKIK